MCRITARSVPGLPMCSSANGKKEVVMLIIRIIFLSLLCSAVRFTSAQVRNYSLDGQPRFTPDDRFNFSSTDLTSQLECEHVALRIYRTNLVSDHIYRLNQHKCSWNWSPCVSWKQHGTRPRRGENQSRKMASRLVPSL